MTSLIAPAHITGCMRGKGGAATKERAAWIAQSSEAGYTVDQIAAALGLKAESLRNNFASVFRKPAPEPVPPRQPRMDCTVMTIRSGGTQQVDTLHHRVSLARAPWDDAEISPDPRHETAPRHRGLIGSHVDRGLIGSHVDRDEPVDHTDLILSALMHADTLRSGAQQ